MAGAAGIPYGAVDFFAELELNNTREWWTAHAADHARLVKGPMTTLGEALAEEFGTPKLFRPHRDVRFSADKSPYKTHQGVVVGTGPGIGYYVQVSARGLMVAGGWYAGTPEQIARYREVVAEEDEGDGSLSSPQGDPELRSLSSPRSGPDEGSLGSPRSDPELRSLSSPRSGRDEGQESDGVGVDRSPGSPQGDPELRSLSSPRSGPDEGSPGVPRSDPYLRSLSSPRSGRDEGSPGVQLERIVAQLRDSGYEIGGDVLRSRPRGIAPDHPRLELLRHKSLTAAVEYGVPEWMETPEVVDRVRSDWRELRPLMTWLGEWLG